MKCYCGSEKEFEECCDALHKGRANADTAEALMRARYSAFAVADVNFIENTYHPAAREGFDRAGTQEWAENSEWCGLQIVATEAGGPADTVGAVEFIATYKHKGAEQAHHEMATFKKHDNQWYFVDGKMVPHRPFIAAEKVGRNDPCTCGSGKKYKKCCGAA